MSGHDSCNNSVTEHTVRRHDKAHRTRRLAPSRASTGGSTSDTPVAPFGGQCRSGSFGTTCLALALCGTHRVILERPSLMPRPSSSFLKSQNELCVNTRATIPSNHGDTGGSSGSCGSTSCETEACSGGPGRSVADWTTSCDDSTSTCVRWPGKKEARQAVNRASPHSHAAPRDLAKWGRPRVRTTELRSRSAHTSDNSALNCPVFARSLSGLLLWSR